MPPMVKTSWQLGDIVETRGGLWEITYIGSTLYMLRNDSGRLHALTEDELNEYGRKVEL